MEAGGNSSIGADATRNYSNVFWKISVPNLHFVFTLDSMLQVLGCVKA